jgi:acyl dehydratase
VKFFEDIKVGDTRHLGSHTFTAEAIKAFARKFDPQVFHLDEEAAAHSHFKKLCASGWHTAAAGMRLNVEAIRREDDERRARGETIARSGPSPGVRDLKWLKPVYVGDTITYVSEVKETRQVSRPGFGIVVHDTIGTNQHGDVVYSVQGAVFVERRQK